MGTRRMARTTALVRQDMLVWRDVSSEHTITVGTPEWHAWLDRSTAFAYEGVFGTCTAHKERFQRGGWYWRAYKTREGKLWRAYLGKSEDIQPARLEAVARKLAGNPEAHDGIPAIRHAPDERAETTTHHAAAGAPLL